MRTSQRRVSAVALAAAVLVALVVALVVAAGMGLWAQGRAPAPATATAAASSPSGLSAAMQAMPGLGASRPAGANPWALLPGGPPTSPLDHVAPPVFKANARGGLHIDAQAGVDIDRLTGLYGRDEALQKIAEAVQALPAQAQREARGLYAQYAQYNQALTTALGPTSDSPSLDEARQQLQTLKALRAQYFGEQADALFGQEEALQQRLLDDAAELMKTRKLSQEEAIGQAQARLGQELASKP